MRYRTELPRMRLAEFSGQTEYPAVCYLHYKLLLREQIARTVTQRQRPGICSPQSDRRQSRMRACSDERACRLSSSPPGPCRGGGKCQADELYGQACGGFSSAADVSGARPLVDAGGSAGQSEMPNRTSFSEVPAARVPRFGDSGRTEAAKLVSIKQESRSMRRGS